jgi:hypothetical protein
MFPGLLPSFADADRRIVRRSIQKQFETTIFEFRVRVQHEHEFGRPLPGQQIDASGEAVISPGPKEVSWKSEPINCGGNLFRSSVCGGVIEEIEPDWNFYAGNAVEEWLKELGAVVEDDQDIDLRRHGLLPGKR